MAGRKGGWLGRWCSGQVARGSWEGSDTMAAYLGGGEGHVLGH